MIEAYGDIWDLALSGPDAYGIDTGPYDAIVITTNGTLNNKNEAVIGSGIALEARERYSWFAPNLGARIKESGNNVYTFPLVPAQVRKRNFDLYLYSFPTKHDWRGISDYGLIVRSCVQLLDAIKKYGPEYKVIMPRPGVGAGKLPWPIVKEMIRLILDDRFTLVTHKKPEEINGQSG